MRGLCTAEALSTATVAEGRALASLAIVAALAVGRNISSAAVARAVFYLATGATMRLAWTAKVAGATAVSKLGACAYLTIRAA